MKKTPRCLIIGAARSGTGKTAITLALALALVRRGLTVRTAKTGPDFIDTRLLGAACGAPAYAFDSWLTGREHIRSLAARLSEESDALLVEGAMGLFDGAYPDALEGSTAGIAMILDAPALLAVNVRGMSRSLAALVKGYASFEPGLRLEGVIGNFAGGRRHGELLRKALFSSGLPPLLGTVERGGFPEFPEKQYGLRGELDPDKREQLADAAERFLDIDRILAIASSWKRPAATPEPKGREAAGLRLGVPLDPAFHFYCQDDLELLEARGVELVRFSPLEDASLPPGLDGLLWGGGLVEDHAPRLAANRPLAAEVKAFAESGRPIVASGNALVFFASHYHAADGSTWPMAGVFPGVYRAKGGLHRLGYVEARSISETPFGPEKSEWRGHEYSYGVLDEPSAGGWTPAYAASRRNGDASVDGWTNGNVLLSPAHARLAGAYGVIGGVLAALRGGRG